MVTSEPPIVLLMQRYFYRQCSLFELVDNLQQATLLVPLERSESGMRPVAYPPPDGSGGQWLAVYTTTERFRGGGAGWKLAVVGAELGEQVMHEIPGICGVLIDPDDPHALGLQVNERAPVLKAMPLTTTRMEHQS